MSQGPDLEALAARTAATDVVIAYAMALDAGDWTGFRALFEDEIDLDYSSLGSIRGVMPTQTWVDRCKLLGAFDATHHKVSNFVVELDGGVARVTSYVDAAHFIRQGETDLQAFACGTYRHTLRRGPAGWKIRGCTFIVAGYAGGRAAFDRAFDAARARFADRQGGTA
jgi:hypothetical protein